LRTFAQRCTGPRHPHLVVLAVHERCPDSDLLVEVDHLRGGRLGLAVRPHDVEGVVEVVTVHVGDDPGDDGVVEAFSTHARILTRRAADSRLMSWPDVAGAAAT